MDEFLVQGKSGLYDYVFHLESQLQLECEMPLEDASLGFSENGYQHVEETKKVLVLMPPPVEPGDAPMNIKAVSASSPAFEKVFSG